MSKPHIPRIGFLILVSSAASLLAFASPRVDATASPAPKGKYIGAKACKNCHSTEAKGAAFEKWNESKHAKAFARLASPEAKKAGAERKVEDPQKSPECLKCHQTAFGEDQKNIKKGFTPEDGVQCESCHGPGEEHFKKRFAEAASGKADDGKRVQIPADEIISRPTMATCVTCHNEKSPTYKPFCMKERVKEIAHYDPRKQRTAEEAKIECTCEKCKKEGGEKKGDKAEGDAKKEGEKKEGEKKEGEKK
jgi:hypothetical protein